MISCNFHRLFLKTNLFSSTFWKNETNFTDFILFSLTFHQFLEIFSNFSQKWTKFQQLFSKMKQISPTFEHFSEKSLNFDRNEQILSKINQMLPLFCKFSSTFLKNQPNFADFSTFFGKKSQFQSILIEKWSNFNWKCKVLRKKSPILTDSARKMKWSPLVGLFYAFRWDPRAIKALACTHVAWSFQFSFRTLH